MANLPLVFLGPGVNAGGALGLNRGLMNQRWYGGFNNMQPYIYYWNRYSSNPVPTSPSYANPGAIQPVGELPPPVTAPDNGKSGAEWMEARSSFAAASAKVSEAVRAVEELRARLQAIGQSPRAELTSRASTAQAALTTAKQRMEEGDLDETVREIQRSSYIAAQVLKEFGR